jgi:soluble lytic murein transglycosylase-like protein
MSDPSAQERLALGLRAGIAPIGEFIHVSAIYMGLAVLTTLGLSLVLPSMRQQSQQLHEVVLTMFQANDGGYETQDDSDAPDWAAPPLEPPAPAPPARAPATPPAVAVAPRAGTSSAGAPSAGAPRTSAPSAVAPSAGAGPRAAAGSPSQKAGKDATVAPPAAEPEEKAAQEGQLTFAQALLASMQDRPVKGMTRSQDHGLRSYLARKYRIAPSVAGALIRTAFAVGHDERVDPQLLLAVIAIESRYNPFVESAAGAQGLMQIMGNVHRDKLKTRGGRAAAFNPVVNIRVGAQILSDCIRRRGSVQGGLACYVGATGVGDGGYGSRVLAERRRIALASGIPLGQG